MAERRRNFQSSSSSSSPSSLPELKFYHPYSRSDQVDTATPSPSIGGGTNEEEANTAFISMKVRGGLWLGDPTLLEDAIYPSRAEIETSSRERGYYRTEDEGVWVGVGDGVDEDRNVEIVLGTDATSGKISNVGIRIRETYDRERRRDVIKGKLCRVMTPSKLLWIGAFESFVGSEGKERVVDTDWARFMNEHAEGKMGDRGYKIFYDSEMGRDAVGLCLEVNGGERYYEGGGGREGESDNNNNHDDDDREWREKTPTFLNVWQTYDTKKKRVTELRIVFE